LKAAQVGMKLRKLGRVDPVMGNNTNS